MNAMPVTRCVDYSFIFIFFSLFWFLFVFILVFVFVGMSVINAQMGKNSARIIIYLVIDTITYNHNRQHSFIMRFGGFFQSLIETMNKKEIKYFLFNSTPCFDSTDFSKIPLHLDLLTSIKSILFFFCPLFKIQSKVSTSFA